MLSRFVLQVDNVSATLCNISAVGFNAINDACFVKRMCYVTARIVLFMALLISLDECSKQPQVTNYRVVSNPTSSFY